MNDDKNNKKAIISPNKMSKIYQIKQNQNLNETEINIKGKTKMTQEIVKKVRIKNLLLYIMN